MASLVRVSITDMDYINTYINALDNSGDYSINTLHAYTSDLKRFFNFFEKRASQEGGKRTLNSKLIKDFLEHENKSGLSASTIHRRKVVLGQFAQFLESIGELPPDDVLDILNWNHKLWKKIYERDIHHLSDDDLNKLFAVINAEESSKAVRDASLISMLLETGLSIGKLISIDLSDLDLEKARILVGSEERTYSIEKSAELLHKYLTVWRKEYTQASNEEALFVSQMGGRISRQGVWQLVKEWGEKAEIKAPISPRVLRNTRAKKLVESGETTEEIQKKLGHTNRHSTRSLVRKINRIAF